LCVASAIAQPSGLTVLHGQATVQQSGPTTTVTTSNGQGTRHSALDWRSFQVPGGQTVVFAQPDALSTSINRVLGNDPSTIAGTLASNGRLVLVNPAGIAVSRGAVVDTAGFTASTLFLARQDAIAGRLRFGFSAADPGSDAGRGPGKDDDDDRDEDEDEDRNPGKGRDNAGGRGQGKQGPLQVEGRVLARQGDIVLIGPRLETGEQAVLEARGGDLVLAAGQAVEITGRGLEGIRLQVRSPEDRAVNLGTLQGDSVAIFAAQLRHSGLVQARSASTSGGRVVLHGTDDVDLRGRIEAARAGAGGSVHVTGDRLVLKASAAIDVRHAGGGGEILLGGGSQGGDARLQNARRVDVDAGAQLLADATGSGPGGTVIVWSADRMDFRGAISSLGAGGGAPGRVEVAARGELKFRGSIARQPQGAAPAAQPAVILAPRQGQSQQVQAVLAQPEAESAVYLANVSRLEPLSSQQEDPYERKRVVVDDVRCSVTR
jgi:filamentous hemagglutinin family protein